MNIAMMICKKSADKCTGFGCFRANAERKGHFADYPPEDPSQIMAYFHCGGCEPDRQEGTDFLDAFLEKLKKAEINRIHLTSCMKKCDNLTAIMGSVEDSGFHCILGTE